MSKEKSVGVFGGKAINSSEFISCHYSNEYSVLDFRLTWNASFVSFGLLCTLKFPGMQLHINKTENYTFLRTSPRVVHHFRSHFITSTLLLVFDSPI